MNRRKWAILSKRFFRTATLAAAAIVGTIASLGTGTRTAHAQVLPVRLKVGVLQLDDGGAKNIAGTPLYLGEADLVLPSFLGPAGNATLTAGYQERRTNGNDLRVIPLTISKTSNLPNPAQLVTGRFYYGAGVGAYLLHAEKDSFSKDQTGFGGFAVAGYQLPVIGVFAEVKYQLVGARPLGARPDGLLFMIGKHL